MVETGRESVKGKAEKGIKGWREGDGRERDDGIVRRGR